MVRNAVLKRAPPPLLVSPEPSKYILVNLPRFIRTRTHTRTCIHHHHHWSPNPRFAPHTAGELHVHSDDPEGDPDASSGQVTRTQNALQMLPDKTRVLVSSKHLKILRCNDFFCNTKHSFNKTPEICDKDSCFLLEWWGQVSFGGFLSKNILSFQVLHSHLGGGRLLFVGVGVFFCVLGGAVQKYPVFPSALNLGGGVSFVAHIQDPHLVNSA